ncbi:MAG: type I phosphomannose isomerase catalytic subunit [Planctomycetota bacterium]
MTLLRPVLLERRCLEKVWGGTALQSRLGIPLPPGQAVGETWELFDRKDGSSPLRDEQGLTLRSLMKEHARDLLGSRVQPTPDGFFPLLLKFIDARDWLSVQVHPGAAQARRQGDGPKSEAWVVLHAGPKARIVRGFVPGTTRAQVEVAARQGAAIEALLHSFTPRTGDVIDIPHGVVHAIGPDVVLFEVQQNSDITYRIWDWGRDRPMHIDDALEALRVGDEGPATVAPVPIDAHGEWLLRTPHFRMRRMHCSTPATLGTEGSFKVMVVLEGMAAIGWRSGGQHPPVPVKASDTLLVPANAGSLFVSPIGPFEYLWIDGESEGRH